MLQNVSGFRQKHLTAGGQGNRPGTAVDELQPDGFLQRMDLLGNGRLGYIILCGRLGKTLVLRHRHEVFQLVQIHMPRPSLAPV